MADLFKFIFRFLFQCLYGVLEVDIVLHEGVPQSTTVIEREFVLFHIHLLSLISFLFCFVL